MRSPWSPQPCLPRSALGGFKRAAAPASLLGCFQHRAVPYRWGRVADAVVPALVTSSCRRRRRCKTLLLPSAVGRRFILLFVDDAVTLPRGGRGQADHLLRTEYINLLSLSPESREVSSQRPVEDLRHGGCLLFCMPGFFWNTGDLLVITYKQVTPSSWSNLGRTCCVVSPVSQPSVPGERKTGGENRAHGMTTAHSVGADLE